MKVAIVVAMANDRVIGRGGALPWRISDDLKWFRQVTMGKPVVMGRKTFDSIGKPLPGRDNIVVTREPAWARGGVLVASGVVEALAIGADAARASGAEEICVIGGADIYRQTLARADRIYLTRVDAEVAGDVFFPDFEGPEWTAEPAGESAKGGRNEFACRYFILDRAPEKP